MTTQIRYFPGKLGWLAKNFRKNNWNFAQIFNKWLGINICVHICLINRKKKCDIYFPNWHLVMCLLQGCQILHPQLGNIGDKWGKFVTFCRAKMCWNWFLKSHGFCSFWFQSDPICMTNLPSLVCSSSPETLPRRRVCLLCSSRQEKGRGQGNLDIWRHVRRYLTVLSGLVPERSREKCQGHAGSSEGQFWDSWEAVCLVLMVLHNINMTPSPFSFIVAY